MKLNAHLTPVFLGFSCGSAGKESACSARDLGLIPGLGIHPGEGNRYPLRYSGLENSMDCIVHEVAKSWTRLNDFHFHTGSNSGCIIDLHVKAKAVKLLGKNVGQCLRKMAAIF